MTDDLTPDELDDLVYIVVASEYELPCGKPLARLKKYGTDIQTVQSTMLSIIEGSEKLTEEFAEKLETYELAFEKETVAQRAVSDKSTPEERKLMSEWQAAAREHVMNHPFDPSYSVEEWANYMFFKAAAELEHKPFAYVSLMDEHTRDCGACKAFYEATKQSWGIVKKTAPSVLEAMENYILPSDICSTN